jgi:hypothetical protein
LPNTHAEKLESAAICRLLSKQTSENRNDESSGRSAPVVPELPIVFGGIRTALLNVKEKKVLRSTTKTNNRKPSMQPPNKPNTANRMLAALRVTRKSTTLPTRSSVPHTNLRARLIAD